MPRLSWARNSYSGHSSIFFVARTMARSASTSYCRSGNTRLTPHMLIRRLSKTMSFLALSFMSASMLVLVMVFMLVMMLFFRGLGLKGAAGELVHELDELVGRGVVFSSQVAGLDRDGAVVQNCQLHLRFPCHSLLQ